MRGLRGRRHLVLGALALAASCNPLPPLPTPRPSHPPAARADPRATGGTINIAVWQEPTSLLSAGVIDRDSFAQAIAAPVAEGLLWYRSRSDVARATGPADHWRPMLAVEVPTSQNGGVRNRGCADGRAAMCVIWKLRQGVRWHDGSELTSHDVCDTYQLFHLRYGDANPTGLLSTAGWDQVSRCTEIDASTAAVDYRSTYGPYLSLGSGVYGILPASILDRAFAANADLQSLVNDFDLSRGSRNAGAFRGSASLDRVLDGTGPFVMAENEPGRRVTLLANRAYWDEDRRPRVDRLVFTYVPDPAAAVAAVRGGAADMSFDLRLSSLPQLSQAVGAGLRLHAVPSAGAEKVDLNLCAGDGNLCDAPGSLRSPYTADPVIRRALLAGINRQAIADAATAGRGSVPPDSWLAAGMPELADPSLPTTAYDPTAAAALLDQAGYAVNPACDGGRGRAHRDGSCITLNLGTTRDDPVRLNTESRIAADLAAIGIHVIQPFTPNVHSSAFFASLAESGPLYSHAFDLALYTSSALMPGEPDRYYSIYHGDCHGGCRRLNQIPSTANGGLGQDASGVSDPELDRALDAGRAAVDPNRRVRAYRNVERQLARDLPEIPLYQQLLVSVESTAIQGVDEGDLLWDFNAWEWSCPGGHCQRQA